MSTWHVLPSNFKDTIIKGLLTLLECTVLQMNIICLNELPIGTIEMRTAKIGAFTLLFFLTDSEMLMAIARKM